VRGCPGKDENSQDMKYYPNLFSFLYIERDEIPPKTPPDEIALKISPE
jgi:hypothetical protein